MNNSIKINLIFQKYVWIITFLILGGMSIHGQAPKSSPKTQKIPKVEFVELKATVAIPFDLHNRQGGGYQLGGATAHFGKVKVTPASERPNVAIRLYQHYNSLVKIPNTSLANVSSQGVDSTYNGYSTSYVNDGPNMLKIDSSDYPGPVISQADLISMVQNGPATASVDIGVTA